jgi:hypothetical protein
MRFSRFALVAALALAPIAAYADDASKTAKIEEMFRITKVDQLQRQVMDQMQGALTNMFDQPGIPENVKADHKELEDEVFAIIKKRVTWEKMKPDFVKLYADNLSETELDAIIAFYKTPGGIALLEKLPILTKKGMEIGQAQMKDVGPEIQETVQKFIERHKAK